MQHQTIFAKKFLRKTMDDQFILDKEVEDLDAKRALIDNWVAQINSGRIDRQKEKSTQADFLNKIFGDVLGYTYDTPEKWHLQKEVTTPIGGKSADGALGIFRMTDGEKDLSDVRVAIELKDARTHLDKAQNRQGDKRTPVEQAFDYANKFGENCKWVIVSNFKEIRLYNKSLGPVRYESWELTTLNDPEQSHELQRFFFLMQKGRLFWEKGVSFVDKILKDRQEEELNISNKFYIEYKNNRVKLLKHLKKHNPKIDELTLFEKTQKLLDRIVFICFCEDYDIIPLRTFNRLIQHVRANIFDSSDDIFYKYTKYLFQNVNEGSRKSRINRFNGGLFANDPILDNLVIKDDCLEDIILMSRYDFATDMNVNILGHIFEQSISDLEVLKAQITGETIDNQGKRKQDGIFYTPEYITRYIVEQTIGGWLNERKTELGEADLPDLNDEDYDSLQNGGNERIKVHIAFWQQYAEALRNIKVIDPACGSGAFLNQVFDFLLKEHQILRNELDKLSLKNDPTPLDKFILTNNIYGVDLNHESVQITKLSLWLKTANKHSELTALDQNILIGNSLIDDPKIAGKLAFKWKKRFKSIFDNGGFDIVVGNPPYGAHLKGLESFLKTKYQTFTLSGESYILFTELATKLLKIKGRLGFIIPDTYLNLEFSKPLRNYLLNNTRIDEITLLPSNVFESANVDTTNLFFQKKKKVKDYHENEVKIRLISKKSKLIDWDDINQEHTINTKIWFEEGAFLIQSTEKEVKLFQKMDEASMRIADVAEMYSGIKAYEVGKGTPAQTKEIRDKKPFTSIKKENSDWLPFFEGKHIERNKLLWNENNWILYGEWLAASREKQNFEGEKILIRKIVSDRLIAHYIPKTSYCNTLLFILKIKDNNFTYPYLLSILNSKLIGWYYKHKFQISDEDTFPQIMIRDIMKFPIYANNNSVNLDEKILNVIEKNKQLNQTQARFHRRLQDNLNIEKFSKKLQRFWEYDFKTLLAELKKNKITLDLKKQDEWATYFDEYKADLQALQTEIDRTDAEIDQMVYALYGLTDEEIQIVETTL